MPALFSSKSSPNMFDDGEWLGGGTLRNETYPGGGLFGPESNIAITNSRVKVVGLHHYTGEYVNALLDAAGELEGLVNMAQLQYGLTDTEQEVYSYEFGIVGVDTVTHEELFNNGGNNVNGVAGSSSVDYNGAPMDVETLTKVHNTTFDMMSAIRTPNPISLTITIINLIKHKNLTMEGVLAAGTLGSVNAMIGGMLTSGVMAAVGVSGIAAAALISIVTMSVVGELMEMATGYDDKFGYGGELLGTDTYGRRVYNQTKGSFAERTTQWGKDAIGEFGGWVTGDGYSSQTEKDNYNTATEQIGKAKEAEKAALTDMGRFKAAVKAKEWADKREAIKDELSYADQIKKSLEEDGVETNGGEGNNSSGPSNTLGMDKGGWGDPNGNFGGP